MRIIEGYIFIPKIEFSGLQPMIGPYIVRDDVYSKLEINTDYQFISDNRLVTFDGENEAKDAAKSFSEFIKDEHSMRIARLYLKFAETFAGRTEFKKSDDLVAILNPFQTHDIGDCGTRFFGPGVEGCPSVYPLAGGELINTNFATYTLENGEGQSPFERACDNADNAARQARQLPTIGQFKLEFI